MFEEWLTCLNVLKYQNINKNAWLGYSMTSLSYVLDVVKAYNCTSPRSVESLSGLKQSLRNELIGQEEGKKRRNCENDQTV